LFQGWLDQSTDVQGRAKWLPKWLRFTTLWLFAMLCSLELKTLRGLRRRLHGVLLAAPRGGDFVGKSVPTAHGKVELAPRTFVEAAGQLDQVHEQQLAAVGRLRLITKREKTSHNSWMHNVDRFVSGVRSRNYLYMHPEDAKERGLSDGVMCQVRSDTGQLEVEVQLSDELMRGAVALPHGWGHQQASGLTVARRTHGVNANLLSPDGSASVEALSGMTQLTAILVDVSAVPSSAPG
jgi:anaerobic selenocysteine-containing dehydrogenase